MGQLTCQSFQCSGERCYQEEAHGNNSQLCHNASHCELYRLNSTSYTARCSSDCGSANATEMCLQSGGLGLELCIMECCNSHNCLQLNATAYGDRALITTPVPTTTTTTTTAPPRNGKVCSSFTCHGEGCFKGQKSSTSCTVGHDFCEVQCLPGPLKDNSNNNRLIYRFTALSKRFTESAYHPQQSGSSFYPPRKEGRLKVRFDLPNCWQLVISRSSLQYCTLTTAPPQLKPKTSFAAATF
ncbi:uncharacterized protein LOC131204328 isoform X3 [Ahaetulla prasina]|uniref:uncharacterized protein LOC131204328 isoform X3 n=1 Tax=Ahaetulla prasina TaxID=499056 RepID=UPI0026498271|nr:uncharacterized protein LOC131204328 isoform X3 [Ahaetulla prasina]